MYVLLYLLAANQYLNQNSDRVGIRRKGNEVSSLFGKRKDSEVRLEHKFICLASCNQQRIPTTDAEKNKLLMGGLGEKEIDDVELSAGEFKGLLYHHFLSLKKGGGFKFLSMLQI